MHIWFSLIVQNIIATVICIRSGCFAGWARPRSLGLQLPKFIPPFPGFLFGFFFCFSSPPSSFFGSRFLFCLLPVHYLDNLCYGSLFFASLHLAELPLYDTTNQERAERPIGCFRYPRCIKKCCKPCASSFATQILVGSKFQGISSPPKTYRPIPITAPAPIPVMKPSLAHGILCTLKKSARLIDWTPSMNVGGLCGFCGGVLSGLVALVGSPDSDPWKVSYVCCWLPGLGNAVAPGEGSRVADDVLSSSAAMRGEVCRPRTIKAVEASSPQLRYDGWWSSALIESWSPNLPCKLPRQEPQQALKDTPGH